VVESVLRPKRSLWRRMVSAGLAILASASWRRAYSGP
jgi:uncharacterized membrane protein YcjF (UPF0283 family)